MGNPMKGRILWIEGERANSPSFLSSLQNRAYDLRILPSGAVALSRLSEIDPDLVVINVPSLRSNGRRICQSIREAGGNLPILVILPPAKPVSQVKDPDKGESGASNPSKLPKHRRHPPEPCEYENASVVLTLPFTLRKLINHIVPLLPGDGEHMLHVGPLRLDLERKRVRCLGREARLTPRLANLLQILMQHPGEVMQREDLFKQVWETKYTGDTRTLDVHISWLRHAIEDDPRNPQLLKTVRGVGYRLDI
jgi:DNA-binding response OmpR family regulator